MIIILLGAPGSGKGTQSKILAAKYGLDHLATGDIFRAEIAAKSALGLKAESYVKGGRLVPDSIVTEMVAGRMDPAKGSYLLDGFPRNLEQAQSLGATLSQEQLQIDLVLFLNLPHEEAIRRLSSRWTCGGCGEVFNVISRPPAVQGKCDKCGKDLIQRDDDTAATAAKRLMVFEDLTRPLVSFYKSEQIFQEIDAARPVEAVSAGLCAEIDKLRARTGGPA